MFRSASSSVSPSDTQPGKEGTYTVNPPSLEGSKTTLSFIFSSAAVVYLRYKIVVGQGGDIEPKGTPKNSPRDFSFVSLRKPVEGLQDALCRIGHHQWLFLMFYDATSKVPEQRGHHRCGPIFVFPPISPKYQQTLRPDWKTDAGHGDMMQSKRDGAPLLWVH